MATVPLSIPISIFAAILSTIRSSAPWHVWLWLSSDVPATLTRKG